MNLKLQFKYKQPDLQQIIIIINNYNVSLWPKNTVTHFVCILNAIEFTFLNTRSVIVNNLLHIKKKLSLQFSMRIFMKNECKYNKKIKNCRKNYLAVVLFSYQIKYKVFGYLSIFQYLYIFNYFYIIKFFCELYFNAHSLSKCEPIF